MVPQIKPNKCPSNFITASTYFLSLFSFACITFPIQLVFPLAAKEKRQKQKTKKKKP